MDLLNKRILLTGATGLIGGEIYYQLPAKENVYCLCRDGENTKERLANRQRAITDNNKSDYKFNIVQGDVTKKDWRLNDLNYDMIIHAAGETSFIHKKLCEDVNIRGTRHLINLIKRSGHKPFLVYIGTATSHGAVKNKEIDETYQGIDKHHNHYTRTKQIAENLIRDSLKDYLILKPTIVMGDNVRDKKLATSIGWAFYILRYFDQLPFNPKSHMDYLPVSYVGKVIIGLLKKQRLKYKEYFISCGKYSNIQVKDFINYCDKLVNKKSTLLDENLDIKYEGKQRVLFRGLKYYVPFTNMNVIYDNSRLIEELPEAGNIPNLLDYLQKIINQISEKDAVKEAENP